MSHPHRSAVFIIAPALVLTPPAEGSEFDDGLLTASEVAHLKLDADWVILSACNTAAADGTPGAQGFSDSRIQKFVSCYLFAT